MRLQPFGDRVIVRPDEAEQKTASGIHLPDTGKRPQEGTVMAKGNDVSDEIGVGAKVIYTKYSDAEIDEDGITYLILTESDIFAGINE